MEETSCESREKVGIAELALESERSGSGLPARSSTEKPAVVDIPALLLERLGVRGLVPMIVQYTGKSPTHIYCWKFEQSAVCKQRHKRKLTQPVDHVLYRWRPGVEEFKDRETVISDSKQGRCHHWLVEDVDRERLILFGDNRAIVRDLKDPNRSCTIENPPTHPIRVYGTRSRIDRFVYFLYEDNSGGWGHHQFSSFDLDSFKFRQLQIPEMAAARYRFHSDGSHLLPLHNALWHLNDQWHNEPSLPFLHRYDHTSDRWDDEKTMLEIPELAHRKKYACVTMVEEGSFLVIGGQPRRDRDYTPLTECAMVTVQRDGKSVRVAPFAPLKQAGYHLKAHPLQDHIYVTCHAYLNGRYSDRDVCVQRLTQDNSWTVVHSFTIIDTEFCTLL